MKQVLKSTSASESMCVWMKLNAGTDAYRGGVNLIDNLLSPLLRDVTGLLLSPVVRKFESAAIAASCCKLVGGRQASGKVVRLY